MDPANFHCTRCGPSWPEQREATQARQAGRQGSGKFEVYDLYDLCVLSLSLSIYDLCVIQGTHALKHPLARSLTSPPPKHLSPLMW